MNEIFQLSIQMVRNQSTLIQIKLRENLMTFKSIKKIGVECHLNPLFVYVKEI